MNIQNWFPLRWTSLISLQSKGLLRVFSNTTVQTHQLFSAQLSLWSNSYIHTWPLENQSGCFFISMLVQDVYSFYRTLTGTTGSWAGVWCGDTQINEEPHLALDSVLGEDWAGSCCPDLEKRVCPEASALHPTASVSPWWPLGRPAQEGKSASRIMNSVWLLFKGLPWWLRW